MEPTDVIITRRTAASALMLVELEITKRNDPGYAADPLIDLRELLDCRAELCGALGLTLPGKATK